MTMATTKRIELKDSGIIFNEQEHTYYDPKADKFLSGITQVIQRQLFPNEFDNIPEAILKDAAAYGTSIHHACQDFDQNWKKDGSQEVQDYICICKDFHLIHERSEFTLTYKEWATNADKIFRTSDDTFSIGDIKSYGQMTPEKREKARWQLSCMAMFFNEQYKKAKIDKLFIIHLRNKQRKDGTIDHQAEIIFINRIPPEICKELLAADLAGEQFKNPYAVPDEIKSQEEHIIGLLQTKAEIEEELSLIKAKVLLKMSALEQKTWATDKIRFTRKLPTTRTSFDVAKFRESNPDIDLTPYEKVSTVSESLQITI